MLLDWLADYTEARVQGTDTYCVSELCQVPGLQESDLTQATGEFVEQAERRTEEGREVAQVLGWTHTRGMLEHMDRVLMATHGVGEESAVRRSS